MATNFSDWRKCVKYLQETKALPMLAESTKRSLDIGDPNIGYEVAKYIKDGVILCRLLNIIRPKALPKINFSSRPQRSEYLKFVNLNLEKFLANRNLVTFLNTCETVFQMSKKDLFFPEDLLNEQNLKKVLCTISKLSQTNFSQEKFGMSQMSSPANNTALPAFSPPPPRPGFENTMYRKSLPKAKFFAHRNVNDFMVDPDEEEIYKSFVDIKRRESCVESISKKSMCIKELITTEQNYVELMRALIQNFLIPLKSIIPKASIDIIFFKIEEMYAVHKEFLKKLENTQTESSRLSVAECFITCKEWFLLYGEYCANITDAQNHYAELIKNPNFQMAFQTCYKEDTDEQQRKILAKAIEEVEPCYHIKFKLFKPAGAKLRDYGKLVKDGELKVKEFEKEWATFFSYAVTLSYFYRCTIFLFDTILLICTKTKQGDLVVTRYCLLSNYKMQQTKDKNGRSFTLTSTSTSRDNVLKTATFKAKDKIEKEEWVTAIETSKIYSSTISPANTPYNLKIHTYNVPTICDVCKKLLKGIFYQGYQCETLKTHFPFTKCSDKYYLTAQLDHKPSIDEVSKFFRDREEMLGAWYVGETNRSESNKMLENTPDGTFLVRKKSYDTYVIGVKWSNSNSLKCNEPSWIKINKELHQYFIEPCNAFNTVKELVQFYENVSLGLAFTELPTKLLFPYNKLMETLKRNPEKPLNLCRAAFSYKPSRKDVGKLPFERGDIINILNTNVGYEGWWQGQLGEKTGITFVIIARLQETVRLHQRKQNKLNDQHKPT
ncbi:hypothetical protein HELRODRAFT_168451 [Helobdella robusta]|uniref:Guanine nucleotide exchange factor VAV2 n=1 Tax=Helobdella robusta TaxID=6412 RepID=T1F0L8_HELRO|nr:hypothetical protein HELRODRAFT_168451 [Helobdella robusta]ESO09465.1 hypothetical protein HELRODRAFT_168451 [Helobdella robusta]